MLLASVTIGNGATTRTCRVRQVTVTRESWPACFSVLELLRCQAVPGTGPGCAGPVGPGLSPCCHSTGRGTLEGKAQCLPLPSPHPLAALASPSSGPPGLEDQAPSLHPHLPAPLPSPLAALSQCESTCACCGLLCVLWFFWHLLYVMPLCPSARARAALAPLILSACAQGRFSVSVPRA